MLAQIVAHDPYNANKVELRLGPELLDVCLVAVLRSGRSECWVGRLLSVAPLVLQPIGAPRGTKIVYWGRPLKVALIEESSFQELAAIRASQLLGQRGAHMTRGGSIFPRGWEPQNKASKRKPKEPEPELPERDTMSHIGAPEEMDEALEALDG